MVCYTTKVLLAVSHKVIEQYGIQYEKITSIHDGEYCIIYEREEFKMEEPICCPPRVDTFLAVTKVKPISPEKPRKTVKEKHKIEMELEACLDDDLEMPEDFWA